MARFVVDGCVVYVDRARDALATRAGRSAPAGAELRDGAGTVLARKETIAIDDNLVLCWQVTDAWPDLESPIALADLARRLDDDSESALPSGTTCAADARGPRDDDSSSELGAAS